MPLFVRNFAEAITNSSEAEIFQHIIAEFFLQRMMQHFRSNGTKEQTNSGQIRINEDLVSIEHNIKAFI